MDGKTKRTRGRPTFPKTAPNPGVEHVVSSPLRIPWPDHNISLHLSTAGRRSGKCFKRSNVPEAPLAPLPLPSLPSHLPPSPCFQNMSLFITGDIAGWARLKQVMIFFPAALRTLLVALRGMREALLIRPFITLPGLPARHSAV